MKRAALALACLVPLASALAPPAAARSSVSREGLVITISVPFELRGLGGRKWRNPRTGRWLSDEEMAALISRRTQTLWNDGLAGWRYRGCYRLRTQIEVTPLAKGEKFSGRRHAIELANSSTLRSSVRTGREDRHTDVRIPYEKSVTGRWSRGGSQAVRKYSHEIGHLMGLADDYDDVEDEKGRRRSVALEGREGTIMADGTRIDQALVDRLGDLVADSEELPGCIRARYELELDGTAGTEGFLMLGSEVETSDYESVAKGSLVLEMAAFDDGKGALRGEATYRQRYTEDHRYRTRSRGFCHERLTETSDPEVQTFEVAGTREGDFVMLRLTSRPVTKRESRVIAGDCPVADHTSHPSYGNITAIAAQLEDGRFEQRTTVWSGDTGGARVHQVVEERDAGE